VSVAPGGDAGGLSIRSVPRPRQPETEIERIAKLFREAAGSNPHRWGKAIPPAGDLERIAAVVMRFKSNPSGASKRGAIGWKIAQSVKRTRADRAAWARWFRERPAMPSGTPDELRDQLDVVAMAAIEPHVAAWAPRPGLRPGRADWNAAARALREPVAQALASIRQRAGNYAPTGPLVEIICALLGEVYPKGPTRRRRNDRHSDPTVFDPEAIVSFFKRDKTRANRRAAISLN
jgi:hypothetical protein